MPVSVYRVCNPECKRLSRTQGGQWQCAVSDKCRVILWAIPIQGGNVPLRVDDCDQVIPEGWSECQTKK